MSLFMVLTKTIFMLPVTVSILIVIKALSFGLVTSLFYVSVICNTLLTIVYFLLLTYSLKYFNLEVPNDDIAWSHN